jgi:hypothetical protein
MKERTGSGKYRHHLSITFSEVMPLYNESRNAGHYSNPTFTALYHKTNLKRSLLILFACFIKQKASARLFQTAWRS